MSSTLDHEIPLTGWQAAWISRSNPVLYYYSIGLSYTLISSLIVLGVRTLVQQRRTRRELAANPSTRACVLAAHERWMAQVSRRGFFVSLAFALHAAAFYLVDAAISLTALGRDAAEIPWSTEPAFLLTLALALVAAAAVLFGAFVLVPLSQVVLVSWWIRRRFPAGGEEGAPGSSLADHVPEARIVATYVSQAWVMLEFFVVAFWPVNWHSTLRIVCFMATLGSSSVWMDASFAFNFCAANLEEVELRGLSAGVARIVRMFGQRVVAAHSFGKEGGLPSYQVVAQIEEYSEKEAL